MGTKGKRKSADVAVRRPDEYSVNQVQARYLARESGLSIDDLVGRSIAEVHDLLKWAIDPQLLFFRKICGRVVKKDPATGQYHGVPNATVHVEDTDCSFLGFFPTEGPFSLFYWLWPIGCRREEIGTVRTDECGQFCVWVPRWDIDRILRLRRERVCLPEIIRPSIRDILEHIRRPPVEPWPPRPGPTPDPPPFLLDREVVTVAQRLLGDTVADNLLRLGEMRTFGASTRDLDRLLDSPAFAEPMPPPLPNFDDEDHPAYRALEGVEVEHFKHEVEHFKHETVLGPFLRCHDVLTVEWQTIVDVPDITFRVAQDIDGDGVEEDIYSEGTSAVRWNAGAISNVTLVAKPIALASPVCDGPTGSRACTDRAEIYAAGPMPLDPTYHEATTGYALRPNRPRPGGLPGHLPVAPSQAPYRRELAIFACHRLPGATQYRVLYEYGGHGPFPFMVPTWQATTTPGQPTPTVPFTHDADGWYDIRDPTTLARPDLVLYWPSYQMPDGHYRVTVECRGPGGPVGTPSEAMSFVVDNRLCDQVFGTVAWWPTSNPAAAETLSPTCPVIHRPPGQDIIVEAQWSASAAHFRNASIRMHGCAGGVLSDTTAPHDYDHWYEHFGDNSVSRTARFTIPGGLPDGAYTLGLTTFARSFHPIDDDGPLTNWWYDQNGAYRHISLAIAVVTQP